MEESKRCVCAPISSVIILIKVIIQQHQKKKNRLIHLLISILKICIQAGKHLLAIYVSWLVITRFHETHITTANTHAHNV